MSEPPNRDAKPNANATIQISLDQLEGIYDQTPPPEPEPLPAPSVRKTPPPLPPGASLPPAPVAASGGGSLRMVIFGVLFVALLGGAIAAGVTVGGSVRGGGATATASATPVVVPPPPPSPEPAPTGSMMTLPTIEVKAE